MAGSLERNGGIRSLTDEIVRARTTLPGTFRPERSVGARKQVSLCSLHSHEERGDLHETEIDTSHRRVFEEWHRAASTRDQAALIALYAPDSIVETPLAPYILDGKSDGILRGRDEIKVFLDTGARKRPDDRVRWYRAGAWFSRGDTLKPQDPRLWPGDDR